MQESTSLDTIVDDGNYLRIGNLSFIFFD